jgi:LacI family transcriptional regulator
MATSRDIARLAGVSQATVSRVLRGSENVSPATRARVQSVLDATGYQPDAAATAMRTRRTGTVGVVVERITNPFYPELLTALGAELERRGLRMILWDSARGPGERAAVEAIEQRRVDGIIFTTATGESTALQKAVERGSPLVLVNRVVEGVAADQVDSENGPTSETIARYFADGGHQRFGLVTGPPAASTARHRTAGFTRGAREAGLQLRDEHVVDGRFSHEGGHEALRRILNAGPRPPTAVFCVNDFSALGVLDAARSLGVAVPDDLWVMGYDDIDMASWESYQLTTARQPVPEMVQAAVDLLLERIDSPGRPTVHRCFASDIIVRRSTANIPIRRRPRTVRSSRGVLEEASC